jgi:hypothetical protein
MTVQELYDHILKNMTAEQALKKMLESSLHEYQYLRFSAEGKEIHPAMLVVMAAQEMGWDIAIPDIKEDEEIQGMVIGTSAYMNNTLGMQKEEKCQCGDNCGDDCCKN